MSGRSAHAQAASIRSRADKCEAVHSEERFPRITVRRASWPGFGRDRWLSASACCFAPVRTSLHRCVFDPKFGCSIAPPLSPQVRPVTHCDFCRDCHPSTAWITNRTRASQPNARLETSSPRRRGGPADPLKGCQVPFPIGRPLYVIIRLSRPPCEGANRELGEKEKHGAHMMDEISTLPVAADARDDAAPIEEAQLTDRLDDATPVAPAAPTRAPAKILAMSRKGPSDFVTSGSTFPDPIKTPTSPRRPNTNVRTASTPVFVQPPNVIMRERDFSSCCGKGTPGANFNAACQMSCSLSRLAAPDTFSAWLSLAVARCIASLTMRSRIYWRCLSSVSDDIGFGSVTSAISCSRTTTAGRVRGGRLRGR